MLPCGLLAMCSNIMCNSFIRSCRQPRRAGREAKEGSVEAVERFREEVRRGGGTPRVVGWEKGDKASEGESGLTNADGGRWGNAGVRGAARFFRGVGRSGDVGERVGSDCESAAEEMPSAVGRMSWEAVTTGGVKKESHRFAGGCHVAADVLGEEGEEGGRRRGGGGRYVSPREGKEEEEGGRGVVVVFVVCPSVPAGGALASFVGSFHTPVRRGVRPAKSHRFASRACPKEESGVLDSNFCCHAWSIAFTCSSCCSCCCSSSSSSALMLRLLSLVFDKVLGSVALGTVRLDIAGDGVDRAPTTGVGSSRSEASQRRGEETNRRASGCGWGNAAGEAVVVEEGGGWCTTSGLSGSPFHLAVLATGAKKEDGKTTRDGSPTGVGLTPLASVEDASCTGESGGVVGSGEWGMEGRELVNADRVGDRCLCVPTDRVEDTTEDVARKGGGCGLVFHHVLGRMRRCFMRLAYRMEWVVPLLPSRCFASSTCISASRLLKLSSHSRFPLAEAFEKNGCVLPTSWSIVISSSKPSAMEPIFSRGVVAFSSSSSSWWRWGWTMAATSVGKVSWIVGNAASSCASASLWSPVLVLLGRPVGRSDNDERPPPPPPPLSRLPTGCSPSRSFSKGTRPSSFSLSSRRASVPDPLSVISAGSCVKSFPCGASSFRVESI